MAAENDVVLIYFEDQPMAFARIEDIRADIKKDWYHVTLLLLQIPLQTVTWILRNAYINGTEFTMGGKRMRLEKVVAPDDGDKDEPPPEPEKDPAKGKNKGDGAKVVPLSKRKPK